MLKKNGRHVRSSTMFGSQVQMTNSTHQNNVDEPSNSTANNKNIIQQNPSHLNNLKETSSNSTSKLFPAQNSTSTSSVSVSKTPLRLPH